MVKKILSLEWLYPSRLSEQECLNRLFLVLIILLTSAVFTIATWIWIRGNDADRDIGVWRDAMRDYNAKVNK